VVGIARVDAQDVERIRRLAPMLMLSGCVFLHVRPPSSVRYTSLPTTNSLGFGRAASRFASASVGLRTLAFSTMA